MKTFVHGDKFKLKKNLRSKTGKVKQKYFSSTPPEIYLIKFRNKLKNLRQKQVTSKIDSFYYEVCFMSLRPQICLAVNNMLQCVSNLRILMQRYFSPQSNTTGKWSNLDAVRSVAGEESIKVTKVTVSVQLESIHSHIYFYVQIYRFYS